MRFATDIRADLRDAQNDLATRPHTPEQRHNLLTTITRLEDELQELLDKYDEPPYEYDRSPGEGEDDERYS